MCRAILELVSPDGIPITLHVEADDDQQAILEMLERAEKIGLHFGGKGWSFLRGEAADSSADEGAFGPTFAGYPCSPTVDERGLPTWLFVDGKQARRREKQGDIWYSVKLADGSYEQVLRIPKGEQVPAVRHE